MNRYVLPLAAFAFGWLVMTALVVPLYRPEVVADYVRAATIGAFLAVVGLVAFVAVLHQGAYRESARRKPMPPPLVWGMGVSYLLTAGTVALALWERLGEPFTYRSVVLAVSLALALAWLIPLVSHIQEARRDD